MVCSGRKRLKAWNKGPVQEQERIIGRKKLSDIELDDASKPAYAHNALTSIEENGAPLEIVRDNMPFGDVGKGEFGTYFIGYARSTDRIEQMMVNMFVGRPPGNYDRLLDFSKVVTGTLFFAPSATFLANVADVGLVTSPNQALAGGDSEVPSKGRETS